MQLETLYQEIILDHYRDPHGKGLREPYDAEVYHINPTCGDEVTLRVRVDGGSAGAAEGGSADHPVVADVSYDSQGCSISQASASVLYDLVRGRSLAEGMRLHDAFMALMQSQGRGEPDEELLADGVAFAGVSKYPARIKCALLAWMAWKDAVTQAAAGRAGAERDQAYGTTTKGEA